MKRRSLIAIVGSLALVAAAVVSSSPAPARAAADEARVRAEVEAKAREAADKAKKDAAAQADAEPAGPLEFTLKDIDGKDKSLADFKGQVVMLVNVASECGATPQYAGLQKLYAKYKAKGFVVVGIPANNFGGQEPGTEAEIKQFCTTTYKVSFPMMSKISVAGGDKDPLYAWLTDEQKNKGFGGEIGWNFTKFLIGRDGKVVGRFNTPVKPEAPEVVEAIEKALAAEVAAAEKKG